MPLLGSLIGAGVSLLGSRLGNRQQQQGVNAALAAGGPFDVRGPFGRADFDGSDLNVQLGGKFSQGLNRSAALGNRALGSLGALDFRAREQAELDRLQRLRQPQIDLARAQQQSSLFNRGRLGLARGGGLSGQLFNPETAGLEEAILRAQLGDIGSARQFSQQEQGFLLDQAGGLFGLAGDIGNRGLQQAQLGIAARNPAGLAGLAAGPGFARARTTEGFFGALGNTIGGLDFGGTFAARPDPRQLTGQGLL